MSFKIFSFLESFFDDFSLKSASLRYKKLTSQYRERSYLDRSSLKLKKEDAFVYANARMPATIAVIKDVLKNLEDRKDLKSETSFLDLGAGAGSFLWAFLEKFYTFKRATLWEGNKNFVELIKNLIKKGEGEFPILKEINFLEADLCSSEAWENFQEDFDIVSCSYAFSEISVKAQEIFLERAWKKTRDLFILIEPGTPLGFSNILRARRFLKEKGGHILAPCTHQGRCPLEKTKDWCHFRVRLSRTYVHRKLKSAFLDYEDEKYAYLIMQKVLPKDDFRKGRVLKNPLQRSGHILLDICTEKGEERLTISKRNREFYKEAQKVKWGDLWTINSD